MIGPGSVNIEPPQVIPAQILTLVTQCMPGSLTKYIGPPTSIKDIEHSPESTTSELVAPKISNTAQFPHVVAATFTYKTRQLLGYMTTHPTNQTKLHLITYTELATAVAHTGTATFGACLTGGSGIQRQTVATMRHLLSNVFTTQ
jgi:hypothetical protein